MCVSVRVYVCVCVSVSVCVSVIVCVCVCVRERERERGGALALSFIREGHRPIRNKGGRGGEEEDKYINILHVLTTQVRKATEHDGTTSN